MLCTFLFPFLYRQSASPNVPLDSAALGAGVVVGDGAAHGDELAVEAALGAPAAVAGVQSGVVFRHHTSQTGRLLAEHTV